MIETVQNEFVELLRTPGHDFEVTFEKSLYGRLLHRIGAAIISLSKPLRHHVLSTYGMYLTYKAWTRVKRVTVMRDGTPLPLDEMARLAPAIGEYLAASAHFHFTRFVGEQYTQESERMKQKYFHGGYTEVSFPRPESKRATDETQ